MSLPGVLVIDDDPVSITVAGQALRDVAEVSFASRAADALARALETRPALILLGVVLPDGRGHDVCRALKSHVDTRDIPIIFVTSTDTVGDETEGLLSGAIDYVTKPIAGAILAARVRNHLELRQKREALQAASLRDEVTGLPNRQRFEETLDVEWRRARRAKGALSLVVAEVVGFSAFARRFGPLSLDDALKRVAAALAAATRRPGDLVARLDQDQFVALLPETDERGAALIAERLASHVAALSLHVGDNGEEAVRVDTAVVTVFPPAGGHPEELLGPAQLKLKSRRDRWVSQPPVPAPRPTSPSASRTPTRVFPADDEPREPTELARVKSTFAAMLLHDLRAPLGVVQMTVGLLSSRLAGSAEPDLVDLVELARRGLENTMGLIADMLEVFGSGASRDVSSREVLNLGELVEETVANARLEGERRGLSFDAVLPDAVYVSGDRERLRRALGNLLGNAIKFSGAGGKISCEVRLVEGREGGARRARLEVRDTGEGIPESELPFIFDVHRQAESRARGAGVGLGLSIVKRIAEAHGGSVTVRSAVGVGSSFTLELPLAEPLSAKPSPSSPSP